MLDRRSRDSVGPEKPTDDVLGGRPLDPLLFIMSRDQRDLHDYLTKEFRRDEQIQIILDRRLADRRRRAEPKPRDQRLGARRRSVAVQEQVKSVGFAVVRRASDH